MTDHRHNTLNINVKWVKGTDWVMYLPISGIRELRANRIVEELEVTRRKVQYTGQYLKFVQKSLRRKFKSKQSQRFLAEREVEQSSQANQKVL